jgi:DNA repair protein RadC
MKIHEAVISYRKVSDGPVSALSSPEQVARYLDGVFDEDPTVEWFVAILLNRKNHPLGRIKITKGIADSSLVHPREVFRPAILAGASAVIVAHNHPSGDPQPSGADIRVTRQLRESGKIIGIDLLDHLILGDPEHYSFSDSGLL